MLNWFKVNIFGIISVIIMAIIFMFSSQNGYQSSKISTSLAQFCKNIFGINYLLHIFSIRKIAHFVLFGLLGSSIFTHLRYKYYFYNIFTYYVLTTLFTAFYAVFDEIHQLFVLGRGSSIYDVLIDISGCMVALIFNFITISILEKRNEKRLNQQLSLL